MEKFTKYTDNKWLTDALVEELSTDEIDPSEFPNPLTQAMKKIFTHKGKRCASFSFANFTLF